MNLHRFVLQAFVALTFCWAVAETELSSTNSGKATLIFQGDVTVQSERLPHDIAKSQLADFLRSPDALKSFASGGDDKNSFQEVPLNSEWEAVWTKCCMDWYGGSIYMPQAGDTVFCSRTSTNFPGLRLSTTVYTGVKIFDEHNMPKYCFLLIGQKQVAKGLPPIVWLFHRIMGTSPTDENDSISAESLRPLGPVKSIYCVEESKQGDGLCFRLDTSFQFKMEFPSMLLKFSPLSRKKAEIKGSEALAQTITKAGRKGLDAGYQAFQNFYNRRVGGIN